ncbi:MAG: subclass B3 metallo-beta-lactamase [Gemmatimonadota bacterium]
MAVLALYFVLPQGAGAQGATTQGGTAQRADSARIGDATPNCASCAAWNAPQRPFRIFGNTYFVGTRGLSAVLITSRDGHVLIDAGLPESAVPIIANVRALGFHVEEIRVILNSHAHYDHAGGIAALQRASGATVRAHQWSARVMATGRSVSGDPQLGLDLPYPPVAGVQPLRDRAPVGFGALLLTPSFTGGHTPGGTSWSWRSCEGALCYDMVYADSQTPVSADDFRFSRSSTYSDAVQDFRRGFALLETIKCDVLLTPHPGASGMFDRMGHGRVRADAGGCREYVRGARLRLQERLALEAKQGKE